MGVSVAEEFGAESRPEKKAEHCCSPLEAVVALPVGRSVAAETRVVGANALMDKLGILCSNLRVPL